MTNIEKVNKFLDDAKTFYFLTTDGDQPKGRPFGFHLLDGDRLYFGCGTFKNVYSQLTKIRRWKCWQYPVRNLCVTTAL